MMTRQPIISQQNWEQIAHQCPDTLYKHFSKQSHLDALLDHGQLWIGSSQEWVTLAGELGDRAEGTEFRDSGSCSILNGHITGDIAKGQAVLRELGIIPEQIKGGVLFCNNRVVQRTKLIWYGISYSYELWGPAMRSRKEREYAIRITDPYKFLQAASTTVAGVLEQDPDVLQIVGASAPILYTRELRPDDQRHLLNACFRKDPAYKEEHEYRIVFLPRTQDSSSRQSRGFMICNPDLRNYIEPVSDANLLDAKWPDALLD